MDGKELIQRGTDAWNSKDQDGFFATYTDDCEVTAPGFTGKGRQGLTEFWTLWNSGFSDNQVILRAVFAEGDHAAQEAQFEGTNDGPLTNPEGGQVPATGRRVSVPFCGIGTVRDGRVASTHLYFDMADLLTQLGLMPGG